MMKTYDPKCEELARYFMKASASNPPSRYVAELAAEIQQTVEDYLGLAPGLVDLDAVDIVRKGA